MDHLPLPDNPLYLPLNVPYLSKKQYDGGDFLTYPQREGINQERLESGYFDDIAQDDLPGFLQTWLYFGLLSEISTVAGKQFNQFDLVYKGGNDQLFVTTIRLSEYIFTWA